MLSSYLASTLNLLSNPSGSLYNSISLTSFINTARQQIAAEYQCCRYLATNAPAIGASLLPVLTGTSITSVTVVGGGTGYTTTPTLTVVGGGGAGAILSAVISGGSITSVTVSNGGTGYTSVPSVNVAGGGNQRNLVTVTNQEVYPFSLVDFTGVPGYSQVLAVGNVSILWGSQRFTLARRSWSSYQAMVRNYVSTFQDVPGIAAQYGQGVSGSLYLYPVPNSGYTMEWDCTCLPAALASDGDVEIIPYPWTDAVPYFAAYLAFNSTGRNADADRMWQLYDRFGKRGRAFSQRSLTVNPYQR